MDKKGIVKTQTQFEVAWLPLGNNIKHKMNLEKLWYISNPQGKMIKYNETKTKHL